ncbi:MAG: hypothetical protein COA79_21990 [Planctomycetota bacterium]|nr:MAG: hypothetical protein COA79_21990 [Planctomycetota bacterium]
MYLPNQGSFKYNILKFALILGFCGWGISFLFTVTSWSYSTGILYGMGASEIVYQPLLDYWLKMASAVFGALGIVFLLPLFNMKKYEVLLPILGFISLFVGIVLIISSCNNSLDSDIHITFIPDIIFCFVTSSCIFYSITSNKPLKTESQE